jgi:Domain of unknown function (DUF4412)
MRRVVRPFVACVLCVLAFAPARVSAQKEFEGAVTMNMNMGGMMSVDIVTLTKAGKVRQELSLMGQNVISIFDASAGTGLMLMPVQKSYMKIDLKGVADQFGSIPVPKITATGRKETIVGYTCENYTVEGPNGTTEMCIATDLGFYMGSLNTQSGGLGGNPSLQAHQDVFRKTFKDGFFPLKLTVSSQGTAMTMTVTRIEPKPVSDDQFTLDIPAGYTEMKMHTPGNAGGVR